MDLTELQKLKEKIEYFKAEKAKCDGQRLQLDKQKKELIAKFNELGVTKDTLPLAIQKLEDEIKNKKDEIDLVLNSLGNIHDTF